MRPLSVASPEAGARTAPSLVRAPTLSAAVELDRYPLVHVLCQVENVLLLGRPAASVSRQLSRAASSSSSVVVVPPPRAPSLRSGPSSAPAASSPPAAMAAAAPAAPVVRSLGHVRARSDDGAVWCAWVGGFGLWGVQPLGREKAKPISGVLRRRGQRLAGIECTLELRRLSAASGW